MIAKCQLPIQNYHWSCDPGIFTSLVHPDSWKVLLQLTRNKFVEEEGWRCADSSWGDTVHLRTALWEAKEMEAALGTWRDLWLRMQGSWSSDIRGCWGAASLLWGHRGRVGWCSSLWNCHEREIRQLDEVETHGSISSPPQEQQKDIRRGNGGWVMLLFIALNLCLTFICSCVFLHPRGCVCVCLYVRDEMLFTQVAVPAQQLLCTTVNLRLIYPSLPHFCLIRTALSCCLCTSAFHWRKDRAYSMPNDPNAPAPSSFEVGWINVSACRCAIKHPVWLSCGIYSMAFCFQRY